jgi:DHA1 family bicyclomycin/chloramphenicol resistance-like MFS transporter
MSDDQPAAPERPMPHFAEFVAMMAALMALTALSIDVMLPALPAMRESFGLSDPNLQQLVITSYVVGFAVGQLCQGPLSDWLGRRPVLLWGLGFYALASFACIVVDTFALLLAARFLQGLANAAPRVVAVAVIRDIYGGRRMAEVMSFIMMVFIVVPIIAPTLGGAVLLVGSWHLIFAALCVIALAATTWMALRLPETRSRSEREPLSLRWLADAFGEAIRNRQTLGYTIATGTVFGSLMGYINSAQQIFVDIYRAGALFPVLFGAAACALALASFVNSRLVMRLGMRRISHAALIGFVVIALVHAGLDALFGQQPLWVFLPLLSLNLFCFGLLMPNFNAIAMEPMGRIAGTASSFIGAVTTALGAALGFLIGQSFDGTVFPLIGGFALFGVLALIAVLITERGRIFEAGR